MTTTYQIDDTIYEHYIVQAIKGRGGFGRVYRVLNTFTQRVRAMKVLESRDSTEALLHEYNILADFNHPHIARVHEAGRLADGRLFILAEYAGDTNLREYIRERPVLNLADIRRIGRQALEALVYMHPDPERLTELEAKLTNRLSMNSSEQQEYYHRRNGYACYHRDIKPENIVVTSLDPVITVKLVDFNAAQTYADDPGLGTPLYTPPDDRECPPNSPSRDLFGLGVVLYELVTGHHPYDAPQGEGKPLERLRSFVAPTDPRHWQPRLDEDWAAFLLRAVARDASARFQTAKEMLAALNTLSDSLKPPPPPPQRLADRIPVAQEEWQPNTNPYVTRLLTLYSQARYNNSRTRGLDEVGKATYIETRLDRRLRDDVLGGRYRLVIITGNAGDGKTAFIKQLERRAEEDGARLLDEHRNGRRFSYQGHTFHTNYDGSQDEGDTTNDAVLEEFLRLFRGGRHRLHQLGADASGHVFLIAINEGRLRDFLNQYRDAFEALWETVHNFFQLDQAPPPQLLLVNLNARSVVAPDADPEAEGRSILDRQLTTLLDPSLWAPCRSCALRERCFIKFNADSLADPQSGPIVRDRLHTLFEVTHLRRKQHLTIREVRSALAYLICADSSCQDVAEMLARLDAGELGPLDYGAHFYYNLGVETRPPSQDRVVTLVQELDPALVANPLDDRALYFEGHVATGEPLPFNQRSLADEFLVRPEAPLSGERELTRQRHRQLRRKFYFERRDTASLAMLPYHYLGEFRAALHGDEAGLDQLKGRLLRALSLMESSQLPADSALYLRVSNNPTPTILSYRRFEAAEFRLISLTMRDANRRYLEWEPDRLRLEHYSRGDEPDAVLDLPLDLVELLLSIHAGHGLSRDEVQGASLNLTIFKNALARLPYQELLLVHHDRRYTISLASDHTLTLARVEED